MKFALAKIHAFVIFGLYVGLGELQMSKTFSDRNV